MTNLPDTLTDKQAMFNAAYIGLAGQGFERSFSDVLGCMYRADDGKKNASGRDRYYSYRHFRPVSKRSTETGMSILRKIADGQRISEGV